MARELKGEEKLKKLVAFKANSVRDGVYSYGSVRELLEQIRAYSTQVAADLINAKNPNEVWVNLSQHLTRLDADTKHLMDLTRQLREQMDRLLIQAREVEVIQRTVEILAEK